MSWAFEWLDPTPRVGWNTLFATAPSIAGPWAVERSLGMDSQVSHANPTLRYFDPFWYVWTNRDTCPGADVSEVYRSRNLKDWMGPSGWRNDTCLVSVLSPAQSQDARAVPEPWHPDTRPIVASHFTSPTGGLHNATDINNSDMDFCEGKNTTVMYYAWGNQQLGLFAMVLAVAQVDVSNAAFARGLFGESQ